MSLLFSRRSKKTIKIIWAVLSIFIALSMVITYSGVTRLAASPQTSVTSDEPTPEQNAAQLQTQTATSVPQQNLPPVSSQPSLRFSPQ